MEQHLARELHRVAEATPIPPDLFPAGRIAGIRPGGTGACRAGRWISAGARPAGRWTSAAAPAAEGLRRRGPAWLAAAAAAALLLLLFTPAGRELAMAAVDLVQTYRMEKAALPHPAGGSNFYRDAWGLEPGEALERPAGRGPDGWWQPRLVGRLVTVGDLARMEPPWPVPTYLGPAPTVRALLVEDHGNSGLALRSTTLMLGWDARVGGQAYRLFYRLERCAQACNPPDMLAEIQSGRSPLRYGGPGDVETREMEVNGDAATAARVGERWELNWWHTRGGGTLAGDLPPEELVRVAESLPDRR